MATTSDTAIDAAACHIARQYKMTLADAKMQVKCALNMYPLDRRSPCYPDQERRERIRNFVHGYTGVNFDAE